MKVGGRGVGTFLILCIYKNGFMIIILSIGIPVKVLLVKILTILDDVGNVVSTLPLSIAYLCCASGDGGFVLFNI